MKKMIATVLAVLVSSVVLGETKAFNASLTPDMAIHDRKTVIEGVTLSVWGENPQTSFALGIVNGSTGDSAGLDWSFAVNYADNYKGVMWAPVNYMKKDSLGWDAGFVNFTEGLMTGLATGTVNYAKQLKGVQFGLFNYVDKTDAGFQLGLINVVKSNQTWFSKFPHELAPAMIFVNWKL